MVAFHGEFDFLLWYDTERYPNQYLFFFRNVCMNYYFSAYYDLFDKSNFLLVVSIFLVFN